MIARRSLLRELVALCAVVGGLLFVWSAPASAQRMHEFSKSFGGEGSGEGQLSRPGALAVSDATGDVYVIDRGNSRVEIFSSSGAYIGQFNGSASPTGVFSWPFAHRELSEGAIAVDNSTNPLDPSRGDVYVVDVGHEVVDKFSASGAYIGQITSNPSVVAQNGSDNFIGVAVDLNGGLWVEDEYGYIIGQFNDAAPVNEYLSSLHPDIPVVEGFEPGLGNVGLAFDSEGNVYVGSQPRLVTSQFTFPIEFSKTGEALVEKLDDEETTGLAVDESSGDVYVDHETSVAAYTPAETLIERFGSAQMQTSEGIAVNSVTGTVYTANANSQEIDVFPAFVVPDVSTGPASNLAETSATVGGVVNPDGLAVTSCVFEYGTTTAYGQSEPCSPSPGSGGSPVAVSAELKGLERSTEYHFRLRVANANGSNVGQDHTFVTPEPVALSEEAVSDVSSASALFSVQVNPGGADATYSFEYGPSVAYGASVPLPAGDLGSGTVSESVSARAEGLLGGTTYHVRVAASNLLGTVYGPDETFTTQAAGGAFVLPDGRAWEMVSPPNKDGALIFQIGEGSSGYGGMVTASAGGGAITYTASAPLGANAAGNPAPFVNTQVLSRRGAGGWSSEDIISPQSVKVGFELNEAEYSFFSPDLSRAIVEPFGDSLYSPEATEQTPYVRDTVSGSYLPLVTASDVLPGVKFGPPSSHEDPQVLAVTPDFSHILFRSSFALTSNAVEAGSQKNLYEWSGGRLQLVNELPDHTVSKGAEFGGGSSGFEAKNNTNAFSSDGSRVFFQFEGSTGRSLYMRDTVAGQTVEVDAQAPGVSLPPAHKADFQIASVDGSKVFFLDEEPLTLDSKLKPVTQGNGGEPADLYVYEAGTGSLKDLTVDQNAGENAEVKEKVLGVSEAGSVVYFVAGGRLAEGAQAGQENLYVESETGSSWSPPRLVAVLSEEDGNDRTPGERLKLTSRVSPDGRYLTFMSDRGLTGYDNRDALSGVLDEEVFLYDRVSGALRCVSCNPTGARPDGVYDPTQEEVAQRKREKILVDAYGAWKGRWLAASIPGWTEPNSDIGISIAYQSRVLSDEGRMFFDSADALVPQDTNGLEDVYEYEPLGVGGSSGCTTAARTYVASAGGCVSLISSGTSGAESAFLDASESGSDVFFLTQARLVRQDVDSSFDVYDAHVCQESAPCASVPVVPPPCSSGDSCKAAPAPQPAVFGAPSSATFSGAGNVAASEPGSSSAPQRVKQGSSRGRHKQKRRGKSRGRGRKSSRVRRSLSVGTRR
jgi:Tol biopolymer transport system component